MSCLLIPRRCNQDARATTALVNFIWMFFLPRSHYDIEILPEMTRGDHETDAEFAWRVQVATAAAIGLRASTCGNQEKNAYMKQLAPRLGWAPCGARAATIAAHDAADGVQPAAATVGMASP